MARRGDGLYLRGKTWYLDFRHDGTRHAVRLGKALKVDVRKLVEWGQPCRRLHLNSEVS